MDEKDIIQVSVLALVEEQKIGSPAVILYHEKTNKILPIWVGYPEARAIAMAMQKTSMPRPMPHKLLQNTIETLGAKIQKIIINKIISNTFYSIIVIERGNELIEIDSRPSDALALALNANVPVFIEKSIMDALSQDNPFHAGPKTSFTDDEKKILQELLVRAREKESSMHSE
ncbi:bifunctional nuclease family protein [Candidatus Peregrinibacteria bacterium]|nr:bifunctional nuclease family protein [Candidatus Peregrinibacteria bacterium]